MDIEDFIIHANIGEFARKVAWIVQLEDEGKFTSSKAFEEIKKLYIQLKETKELAGESNAAGRTV